MTVGELRARLDELIANYGDSLPVFASVSEFETYQYIDAVRVGRVVPTDYGLGDDNYVDVKAPDGQPAVLVDL